MIATYRKKETFEILKWDGENKDELEDFVGKENVEWKFYTNHYAVPCIKNSNSDIIEVDEIPYYIVEDELPFRTNDRHFTVYNKIEFNKIFEKI